MTAALTGRQSAIVLVDDVDAAVLVVNAYAAEHLEIQTADAPQVASRIRSAGAIFVGPWSPVSLGDYCAGSTMYCRPRAAPGIPAACRCRRSCAASTSWNTRRRPSKTFPDT